MNGAGKAEIPVEEFAVHATTITHEQIAARAYDIYQARINAGTPGDDLNDWLQAEEELSDTLPHRLP